MTGEIRRYLEHKREQIKAEFADVRVTPRQFSRFGGDLDYAEWEIITQLQDREIWDGWSDHDAVTTHPEFVKTVRWQAAYNTEA